MSTIWDFIQTSPNERPKYTRYELAKMVHDKRVKLGLTVEDLASRYEVNVPFWESIESASRAFNVRIYKLIGSFLGMSKDELLAKEFDDETTISFRTIDEEHIEIKEAVQAANAIFNEMVMQEKIGV